MNSRENILAAVKNNQPSLNPLPDARFDTGKKHPNELPSDFINSML
jgi:hypothetical protein